MITASDVANLRDMTGAGMMDCKKALVEAEGNMDKAVEILREKGRGNDRTLILWHGNCNNINHKKQTQI